MGVKKKRTSGKGDGVPYCHRCNNPSFRCRCERAKKKRKKKR